MVYFDLPPQQPAIEVVETAPAPSSQSPLMPLVLPLAPLREPSVAEPRLSQTEELPTLPAADPPGNGPSNPSPVSEPGSADPAIIPEPLELPEPVEAPQPVEGPVRIEIEGEDELTPVELANRLQLTADYQEYDPVAQTITARGNVVLRLNDAIIESDRLWVNLVNRYALAEGDVLLTRGSQIIRGSQAEYSFIQQSGAVSDAAGTLFLPDIGADLASPLEGRSPATRRAYDPINRNSDLRVGSDGSVQISTTPGARPTGATDGTIQQLRFETDQLAFDVEGYQAEGVRITNDPFSPPELELRADSLLLRNISATQDELLLKRPRLVFDQGFSLPLLRSRILLSRGTVNPDDLSPLPAQAGIDGSDRGGFFLGRKLPLIRNERVRLSVTPQFFIAKAFSSESSSPIDPDNFGISADLRARFSPRTTLQGTADLTSLDPSNITEKLRTNIRAEQLIGDHRLALQYSYRERLFNGSLGFQDVQYSLGAVLLSPEVVLGANGPRLTYQASAQLINAASDRPDLLLARGSDTGRITLGRYQASAALRQGFNLWRGEPKPATQTEGLRFTPQPLIPYLNLNTGLRATGTYYSSGDFQEGLIAEVGIDGQFGHLARNFGDYTRFNLSYAQSFIGGADSPFLFDREIDRRILSLGLTQQIYGPFLAGFQTALSLNRGRTIDTIYTLEYSRRTYGILLRYDTTQNAGSIGFRLSNFSWVGDTDPFDSPRIRQVESGVVEEP